MFLKKLIGSNRCDTLYEVSQRAAHFLFNQQKQDEVEWVMAIIILLHDLAIIANHLTILPGIQTYHDSLFAATQSKRSRVICTLH
jgi:hypothetical protein